VRDDRGGLTITPGTNAASGRSAGAQAPDWPAIQRSAEFQGLVHERRRFLTPAGLPFAWIAAVCMVFLTWALT
jgi:hypothetical protein